MGLVRDCQEIAPHRGTDGQLHREYIGLPPRECVQPDPQLYAASIADLAEAVVLLCELNSAAPFEIRKARIVEELERHADLPKRP